MAHDYTIIADINDSKAIKDSSSVIVTISTKKFIDGMLESYKSNLDLIKQFIVDFDRLSIYIDDIKYTDIDIVLQKLLELKFEYTLKNKSNSMSFLMFTMMLCCQSSFFFSFVFLHQNYINFDNLHPSSNSASGQPKEIRIYQDHEGTNHKVKYNSNYSIVDITTNTVILSVDTQTDIDLNEEMSMMTFDVFDKQTGENINKGIKDSMIIDSETFTDSDENEDKDELDNNVDNNADNNTN